MAVIWLLLVFRLAAIIREGHEGYFDELGEPAFSFFSRERKWAVFRMIHRCVFLSEHKRLRDQRVSKLVVCMRLLLVAYLPIFIWLMTSNFPLVEFAP